jgi:hypothetical protein
MTWFPLGPDFVNIPRDSQLANRLSRRNELPRQTMVERLAVDPLAPATIYTIETPNQGGSGAWRTDDGGNSWVSIINGLQTADPTVDATCIAVNPVNNNYVYLGTQYGAVFASGTRGATWGPSQIPSGTPGYQPVTQIVVDPRGAANPATTVLYAATLLGLFRSPDGGATWAPTQLTGIITSIAAYIPSVGTPHFYVGVWQDGVYHTTDPTGLWTHVAGLPTYSGGNFDSVLIDYCQANPSRVYVWFATAGGVTFGLYTSGSAPTGFAPVNIVGTPPNPGSPGIYCWAFAVAPNSPGNGAQDLLFFASTLLQRSTDGGQHWHQTAEFYHADQHAFGFLPPVPPSTIPSLLIGCDGGLVASTRYADPTYDITVPPADFDDRLNYDPASGVLRNLNHGKLAVAVQRYHADPSAPAIGYASAQDTGLAAGGGTLVWRGLVDADGRGLASALGSDGVKVWLDLGFPFAVILLTDQGGTVPLATQVLLTGASIVSFSNHIVDANKKCVAGVQPVTASTSFVARIDQSGVAGQVSQNFGTPRIIYVAGSPTDDTLFSCITQDQTSYANRFWVTPGGPLGPGSVWNEPSGNLPVATGAFPLHISTAAIDGVGNVYVLLTDLNATVNGNPIATPLFQIVGGAWVPLPPSGLPTPSFGFGPMVADPGQPNTLYAAYRNRVYQVQKNGSTWTWTNISDGLYGPLIMDLWIANIGTIATPKVLLRASVAARGVMERDVTAGAVDPAPRPYVRNHFLDTGWLSPVPDSLVNPFVPATFVYHYQSPDIKVDAQQQPGGGVTPFFQTDAEGGFPPSHVAFEELSDNSEHLPSMDQANVHVQVHNRSFTTVDNLNVWAIYAPAAGGVPSLFKSLSQNNMFPFWNQFQPNGQIAPNLPVDSPWQSAGPPQTISGIDVTHPQIASWHWTVPTLSPSDPGHYCMVAFLHGPGHLINESGGSVDSITQTNPQIAQKNLQLGPHLSAPHMLEYVEFHNPEAAERVADLVVDLRRLPPELRVLVRLSELNTVAPLDQSLAGIASVHRPGTIEHLEEEVREIGQHILRALDRIEDALEGDGDDDDRHRPRRPRFTPPIYQAQPSALVEVRGVRFGSFGMCAALIVVEHRGELPEGSEYTFEVQQRVERRIVGGSTYVVRIGGPLRLLPPLISPTHRPDPKGHVVEEEDDFNALPPWLQPAALDRAKFLGRR